MTELRWSATLVTAVLGLIAFGALVAMFVLGYMACFRPGSDEDLVSAAFVSVFLAIVAGFAAVATGSAAMALWKVDS